MSPAESAARAYCAALGKDPDEMVSGHSCGHRIKHPRWQGLIGAGPATAEGATERSPNQVALLRSRRPA